MHWDVIVVGGGPCGSLVARRLSKMNYDVLVLEEHPEIGKPVQCAGLISQNTFKFADINERCIENRVHILTIYSPSGNVLHIKDKKNKPVVVDRSIFDKSISISAIDNGARYNLLKKVISVEKKNSYTEVICKDGDVFRCKYVVNASGARNIRASNVEMIKCVQYVGSCSNDLYDVKVFLGKKIAPGFFAWLIPLGDKKLIAGLGCTEGNALQFLKSFLKKVDKMIGGFKAISVSSGIIPIGLPKLNVGYCVGDAAHHVKPLTGGGLVYGLKGAYMCAESLHEKRIKKYEDYVKKEILPEISKGLKMRKIFLETDDKVLDEVIKILGGECVDIIEKNGDMDSPTSLAKLLLLKSPRLLKFARKVIKTFLDF